MSGHHFTPYQLHYHGLNGPASVLHYWTEMQRAAVVIVGAGGHAKVIVDILERLESFEVIGFTSRVVDEKLFDYLYLGADSILPKLRAEGVKHAFPAVGDNRIRQRLLLELQLLGFLLPNAISPNAIVTRHIRLGSGIAIMPGAVINADARIDDGAVINTGATIDHDCEIGSAAHVGPGVHLAGKVSVGQGAFLGIGCSVIPEIAIGAWATVGAGAAVIRNIPDHAMVAGVPASRRLDGTAS